MTLIVNDGTPEMMALMDKGRKRLRIFGVVLLVLGIIALAFPFATTIAAKTLIGWLFIIGAAGHIYGALNTESLTRRWIDIVQGVLFGLIGGWLAFFPLAGIVTLTALLAIAFVLQGILEITMAFWYSQFPGWKWMLISGGIAVLAGGLIFAELPSSATWAIGLLLGINLLSSGFSYLMVAMAMGAVAKRG
ncbi:HdeD family acid-resistance protein [Thalassospira alkalitolerans]|uniref:HdeD family acid-resistance protein n=1 Tax=Thalassospira alkalitolerans TaxID=1293890 RepID=UPI0030EB9D8B|tara:strand:- start:129 stop:701 length:573 start_codon:yes stop_codon:yes gene_type:complete